MNPEFKRNLWLQISPARLVLMPALIALALATAFSLLPRPGAIMLSLSVFCFAILTIICGLFQAGNALSQEFIDGTWDSQRMSALTPWQMTWGKLFGGTIYAWYGGIMLLAIAGFCSFEPMDIILIKGVGLICTALIVHISALLSVLLAHRTNPGGNSRLNLGGLAILFLLLLLAFFNVGRRLDATSMLWWRQDWNSLHFMIATLAFLAVWALIGLWEMMRRELMLRNRVWWWPVFLSFWLIWKAGFVQDSLQSQQLWDPFLISKTWASYFASSAIVIGLSGYLLLFTVRKDQGMWLRLLAASRSKRLWQHLESGWLISFIIAIGLGTVAVFLSQDVIANLILFLGVCAFVARDIVWIFWLNLVITNPRRTTAAALVSLIVAYGLLPFLFPVGEVGHIFLFMPLSSITRGIHSSGYLTSLTPLADALIQAALCIGLFYRRWRSLFHHS